MTVDVYLELPLNSSPFANGLQGTPAAKSVLIQVDATEVAKSHKSQIAQVLLDAKENGAAITQTGDRTLTISVVDRDAAISLGESLQRIDRVPEIRFSSLVAA